MTNISKKSLTDKQLRELFSQLSLLIGKSTTANAEFILSDLLGYEERVMLAKRLAAIILLQRSASQYKTAQTLKISTATAAKIDQKLRAGEYMHLANLFDKNTGTVTELLETIDSILHLGGVLPHYGQSAYAKHRKQRR